MTTPFRKALPDGSAMPIRKHRTDCPFPIGLRAYRPTSNTVECWTTRVGPTYRTSNRESPSRLFHPAIPPSFRAVVPGFAGALQAELAARLECSFSWASSDIVSNRVIGTPFCHPVPEAQEQLMGPGLELRWRNVKRARRRRRHEQTASQPPRRPMRASLIGPMRPGVIAPVSFFSQIPRFAVKLLSNTWGVLPACLGHGTVGWLRRPRIHSGTFALSSAGRDRIGLAWGTVPQAR